MISKLLESCKKGRIGEDICRELSLKLQDVYEIKRLGDICRKAGLPGLAINAYNRALSLCRDPILRPVLQNNLGQANSYKGDLAKAAFYYQKAADCFAKDGDNIGLAHVLGNLGSAYRRNKDWDKAIEHCYRSLKTFEEKGNDLGIAQMTGSLGRIYADMGENELAIRYFERSLADFQRLGDKRSAAWVLDRLGRIASQRKDWDKALRYFNSSLSLFALQGESQSQGIVLSNLGRTYLQMGQANAAREPFERAVLLISRQTKPDYQNTLHCLAKTYSSLAKDCLRDEPGRISTEQQKLEASRLFAQAEDRYQELASLIVDGQAAVMVAAAVAKCQSYLARLGCQIPDKVALQLLENAFEFLDDAAANADGSDKAGILELQRIIAGMKEIRCIGLLTNEPLMQSRAITRASKYLMDGSQGWASEEERDFLCQALRSINACIEVQISGGDPAEKLQAAAAALRQASAAENGMIAKAAEILEGSETNVTGQCQAALLLIAGAMAGKSLSKIEDGNSMMTWDESLHIITKTDLPILESSNERHRCSSQLLLPNNYEEQPQEAGIKEAVSDFDEAPANLEIEKNAQESPLLRLNASVLLRPLAALLVMLLAIEAILYLI